MHRARARRLHRFPDHDPAVGQKGEIKTGLGRLRRVTNIAAALAARAPHRPLALLTNAALGGLDDDEARLYRAIASEPRDEMARSLRTRGCALAVVDTAVLPDLHAGKRLLVTEQATHRCAWCCVKPFPIASRASASSAAGRGTSC